MIYGRAFGSCLLIGITHCLTFYIIEPRTLAFIQFIVQFSKVIVVITRWRRLVYFNKLRRACQGCFELFSKFNHPSLHGADHDRMKLLLCQGLAPTAHLVYYYVKRLSRIFFKSLTPAVGRPRLPS